MQLIFAVLVAGGWYYYFANVNAGTGFMVGLLIATGFAVFGLGRFHKATQAAHNAVAAAATHKTLSPSDQERVHTKALEILRASGWHGNQDPSFEDDVERFGCYALALAELAIPPVCLIKRWNLVRNPFREALNPNHYFATSMQLSAKQGHPVSLQRPAHRQ